MKIAICDDDEKYLIKIEEKLNKYKDAKIFKYYTVESLINSSIIFDIAFLDIRIGNRLGFEAAKYLKEKNERCVLSVFSNYNEYLKQGYEYRIYRYILKEEPDKFIEKEIDDVILEYKKSNRIILLKTLKENIIINADNLIYIDIVDHTARLHMKNGIEYECNKSLCDIENSFDMKNFQRCHKTYIVNMDYVTKIIKNNIFVYGDIKIPIGRKYKKQLLDNMEMKINK